MHVASVLSSNSSPFEANDHRSLVHQRPVLLAPAGDWDCVKAAVENGADAIYFGLDRFNARMRAHNFTEADLPDLMTFLHQRGVRGYVTVNTLIFTEELAEIEGYLRSLITAGVDAAIVQDVGLCRLIRQLSPDFPIHASTQMTITSAAGVAFAENLGCELVVLARECSIAEIEKIQAQMAVRPGKSLPLEVFVHGALCVAYSGQCLTSEALGGRSANRGECAQACRMPYELVVDGEVRALGDRRYLLSPQDLAGLSVLPELVRSGVSCLKIEGRLKAPEYVASVTRVYREALDRVMADLETAVTLQALGQPDPEAQYELEMAFSRGLYTGWFEGIDNQKLVHGEFAKKRGVYLGQVRRILPGKDPKIAIRLEAPLSAGDGVVFAGDYAKEKEQGGRVYGVEARGKETLVAFGRRDLDLRRIQVGDRLYKTSDPALSRRIRQTYSSENREKALLKCPIRVTIQGGVGQPLRAIAQDPQNQSVQVESSQVLEPAQNQPLTPERLQQQFSRLGNTAYELAELTVALEGEGILPVSELNRMRRALVEQLDQLRERSAGASAKDLPRWTLNPPANPPANLQTVPLTPDPSPQGGQGENPQKIDETVELMVLVRRLAQLRPALEAGITTLYCELEDPAQYRQAVALIRAWTPSPHHPITPPKLFLAPPRITKPKERYILDQIRKAGADGYLIRNYDQLDYFADLPAEACIGDFSLNVANPLTAEYFKQQFNLSRLTASYDLNAQQLAALARHCPPDWLEVTIHQHMPMFHMEHCVFCAFLSEGKDFRDCGRPCETHEVKLRDRVGKDHLLHADAGCRNTLFNSTAQTGAEAIDLLRTAGLHHFRIEFLQETPDQVTQILRSYQRLLAGHLDGKALWRSLKLQNQLGVTRGTLEMPR